MKKYLFLIAAAAAMVLASCQPSGLEVEVSDASSDLVTITITASLDEATKATVDDGAKKWVWSEGDQLAVFDGVAKRTFDIKTGVGTSIATFTGDVDGGAVALNAVFPYSAAGATYEDYTIPAVQTVTAAAVADPAAMVATATGEKDGGDYNFTFTSAVSFMRFTSDAAGRFIFHAVDKGDKMTGDGRVVAVDAPSAGTWWVAVKPATYTGLRVFRRIAGHDYLVKSDAALNLSTPGAARELGTINSTSTEVVAIETADELIAYLGGSPAYDAYICADLDMTAKSITTCASYALNFDGQYHTISKWTSDGVALFGTVTGSVNNLTLDSDCVLTPASGDFGFIICDLQGSIKGCVNKANIAIDLGDGTTQYKFGVLVSSSTVNTATIQDCENYGNITVDWNVGESKMSSQLVGGIVGRLDNPGSNVRIKDCTNHADLIKVNGLHDGAGNLSNIYCGGIVAATVSKEGSKETQTGFTVNFGTIQGCVNEANIDVSWAGGTGGYFNIGGIIGYGECAVDGCENKGNISFTNSTSVNNARPSVGGIAGTLAGTATVNAKDCVNRGNVSITGSFANSSNAYAFATGGTSATSCGGCIGTVGDNATLVDNCDNYGKISVDAYMPTGNKSGAFFGGVVGQSFCPISNCENYYDATTLSLKIMAYKTYWGGVAGSVTGAISSCTNKTSVTYSCNSPTITNARLNYVAGIVGYCTAGIDHCINDGAMNITFDSNTGYSYVGGICAYSEGGAITFGYNENHSTADIVINGNSMVKQIASAGIVGYHNTAGSTYSYCSNAGDISVSNWSNAAYNYVGGILGSYNSGNNTIDHCTNTGNFTSTAACKMRIGGIAAALAGTLSNSTSNSTISMSNGKALSAAGGLLGYSNANVSGCSSECILTASDNASTSRAGLLFGDIGGTRTTSGTTAAGSITTNDASTSAGFIAGAYQAASANHTFGAAGNPISIASTASINGAVVSLSEPPTATELIGDTTTAAGAVTIVNVVVE